MVERLCDRPELCGEAAQWFSQKWGIPAEAYQQSIEESIGQRNDGQERRVPQWYIILDEDRNIIAGAGIIENDFHDRPDLSPNLCALFVEEPHRKRGLAKCILDFARKDVGGMGFETLYLVTDHTEFYERCGWDFLTMVRDEDGSPERMYAVAVLP